MTPDPIKPISVDSWESCPAGLISETVERTEKPTPRRTLLWSTLGIAMLLMLVSYSLIEAQPVTSESDSTVNCQMVRGNLAAYCNNRIRTVSLKRAIGKHLIDCESCHKEYRSICDCSKRCPNRKRKAVTKPCMNRRR